MIAPAMLDVLRCPATGQSLQLLDDRLVTSDGCRSYAVVDGIPCLIPESSEPTHQGYRDLMKQNLAAREEAVDLEKFVNAMLVPTCGNLFHGVSIASQFPIPDFPAQLKGGLTLDIGCNWGRWSVAGAMTGHKMVGLDIHLESLFAARQLARRLCPENQPFWVLADSRSLPFASGSFDSTISYSVIQHFSRQNASIILGQIGRVLKPNGVAAIQMPNRDGLKTRLLTGRRRFAEGEEFDVRYYAIGELIDIFGREIGSARWEADCFFGLNVHAKDKPLLPASRKLVVDLAEFCLLLSRKFPKFGKLADSVWITAEKAVA